MSRKSPIELGNDLLEGTEPLTSEDKKRFAYFGVDAKILPPYRILNPGHIVIGDVTAIREGCHINAFADLTFLRRYIDDRFRDAFDPADYIYDSRIEIGRENQIGRFAFMSCTNSINLGDNVLVSERVFIGDNNHGYAHPQVPIMQQPNQRGQAVSVGRGSWIGVGAALLPGVRLGENCVVGANSVCRKGDYPARSVIGPAAAEVLYRMPGED